MDGNRSKEKVAIYTGTRNLYEHMLPAVKSLICHSDVNRIWLFIEDDEFPYELPDIVSTRNVSKQTYFRADNPNHKNKFTYMAMIRTCFTKEFPELDRILSLDVDTIAIDDVSDIWNLPIDDCYFSASREPDRSNVRQNILYTNAGVMLQNLKKLREDKIDDKMIEALNKSVYTFLDQDTYNKFCLGFIHDMPSKYNVNEYTAKTNTIKIVHYAGYREWFNREEYLKYKKLSWDDCFKIREASKG